MPALIFVGHSFISASHYSLASIKNLSDMVYDAVYTGTIIEENEYLKSIDNAAVIAPLLHCDFFIN